MSKRISQKCWKCAKCTNENLCEWVADYNLPAGAIVNNDGYIVDCPNFIKDNLKKQYDDMNETEKAEALGIPAKKYHEIKHYLKLTNKEMTVEEYIQIKKQRRNFREESKEFYNKYFKNLKRYMERKNISTYENAVKQIEDDYSTYAWFLKITLKQYLKILKIVNPHTKKNVIKYIKNQKEQKK